MNLSYAVQPSPDGLAQALVMGADYIGAVENAETHQHCKIACLKDVIDGKYMEHLY